MLTDGFYAEVTLTYDAAIAELTTRIEKLAAEPLPEILKSSFCGRFPGRWDDVTTDAGAVWAIVRTTLTSHKVPLPDDAPS